jgi:hypothetical protein
MVFMVNWGIIAESLGINISALKKIVKHFIESKKSHPTLSNCNIGGDVYISTGNGPAVEYASKLFSTGKFGFMREEIMPPEVVMLCEAHEKKDDLEALKGVLASKDHNAIVMAYAIIGMDNLGLSDKAKEVYHSLLQKHGERGKRIYNLTRGGYLDDLIFDIKWERIVLRGTPEAVRHKIHKRLDTLLDYCKDAIFISQHSLWSDVGKEIIRRLLDGVECVNLHFREPTKSIAENAVKVVDSEFRKTSIEEIEDGNILDRKAYIWVIS